VTTPEFHRLRVADVRPETDDAVSVTFEVPPELAPRFRYLPGQHVTVRAMVDGEDVRRSYSICANANSGELRIGIKRLAGGRFSTYATTRLSPGDVLEVMPPVGEFTIDPDPARARHYAAVAAGSGITPVLSLVSTVLETERESRFTLIYGNRESRSIMFLEDVEGIKDRYPSRFHLVHVLSRETGITPLLSGRIDAAKLRSLLTTLVPLGEVDEWFLCGPYEMVRGARLVLTEAGVDPAAVHDELFFAGPVELLPPVEQPVDTEGFAAVTFTLEGRASTVAVDAAGASILDHALAVRRELPYSCKGGMCASCRARVVSGEVRMDKNYALVEDDLAAGYVLTCQAHPVSEVVELDYDV
jgi:ring-1,2-phenylacetyl-CoA epoxidase subunit PaaE